jgi:hypothetical protein
MEGAFPPDLAQLSPDRGQPDLHIFAVEEFLFIPIEPTFVERSVMQIKSEVLGKQMDSYFVVT